MLSTIQEQRMLALNRLIGYGNPQGRIWVFGIEERGAWGDEQTEELKESEGECEILNSLISESLVFYNNETYKMKCPLAFYSNQKNLTRRGRGLYGEISRLFNIDVHSIGNQKENIFIGNFLPLANKKYPDEYPSYYRKLFSISSRNEYNSSYYYAERINNLKNFFLKYFSKEKCLILFGKKLWNDYLDLLVNKIGVFKKDDIKLNHNNYYQSFKNSDGGSVVFSVHPACYRFYKNTELKKYL